MRDRHRKTKRPNTVTNSGGPHSVRASQRVTIKGGGIEGASETTLGDASAHAGHTAWRPPSMQHCGLRSTLARARCARLTRSGHTLRCFMRGPRESLAGSVVATTARALTPWARGPNPPDQTPPTQPRWRSRARWGSHTHRKWVHAPGSLEDWQRWGPHPPRVWPPARPSRQDTPVRGRSMRW